MPDDFPLPDDVLQWAAEVSKWAPDTSTLPAEAIETAQALQPYLGSVKDAIERLAAENSPAGVLARQQDTMARIAASFPATDGLTVPTPEELAETESELLLRALPGVPAEELQVAVEEIPADPEKRDLVAFLTDALQQAASISSNPWAVFVIVFWVAMQINPVAVGALALAYAVAGNINPPSK